MKKILLIFLLAIIGITAKSWGQGTCTNATILSPTDTIIQLSANDSVAWFVYQTSTQYLELTIYSPAMADALTSVSQQTEIHLYSGSCNNLLEILDYDSLNPYSFFNINLAVQMNYFIKVKYKGELYPKLFIKKQSVQNSNVECIHNCNLIANGNFNALTCNFSDYNPFYKEQVNCWCAAWGSPQINVFGWNSNNNDGAAYLACGFMTSSINATEGIFQNINIESNRNYNLSFKYRGGGGGINTPLAKLHILISNDNFEVNGCLGEKDDGGSTFFHLTPTINNIIWQDEILFSSIPEIFYNSNIQIPANILPGNYKLLFYIEHLDSYNSNSNPSLDNLNRSFVHIDNISLIPLDQPTPPVIIGKFNNCDPNTTYSIENPNPNFIYNWSITPVTNNPATGTIYSGQNTPNVSVLWGPIDINNPAVLSVGYIDANGCPVSGFMKVYQCCLSGANMIHDQIINDQSQLPFNGGNVIVINGTVTFNENITLNANYILMGPYAKIIVTPGKNLTITNNSLLNAGCEYMWDGIYISDPYSEIGVTGSSTIQYAINGLVSENGGVITTNDATLKNNYYSIRVKNTHNYFPVSGVPYTPYPGSIKNTRFEGNMNLPLRPYLNQKSLAGIDCNNANNFTIGDDATTALRNYFSDMRFGIYANNSDLNIYNNKFTNIVNGYYLPIQMQKYYPEGAIYAVHKDVKPYNLSNNLITGGNNLKRNYFESCNTGIYSFQYVNTLNNNDFKDCVNGISLVDISSGTRIADNMVYGTSASTVTPGKGISVRNTHSPIDGVDCLIEENHITNKRTGISILGVRSSFLLTRVSHNYINNYISGFPTQPAVQLADRQSAISVSNSEGIEVSLNNINRNYPALGANMEQNSIIGIWVSDCWGANIFQNYMTHMGSGIYTNGLLSNTKFNCNTLDDNYHGFQFGFLSSVSQQGVGGGYNPCNKWLDFNPQVGHERMFDNGLTAPFDYYYDPNANQMYNPNSSPYIVMISNPGVECLCVNNGTVGPLGSVDPINNLEAREVALGQIVRDEKYYGFLEEEYKAKDREYVYTLLREDPSIMNMGGADDNVYLQFYNDGYNSDIESVLQMREEMYEQNLELARQKLEQIADDNTINTNRRIVDRIYINTWASGIYDFSLEQENALTAVANLAAYAGGDAVYTARVMLNIDPMDIGVDYAKPPQNKLQLTKVNMVKVFPNPTTEKITIEFNDIISKDAVIEIYGNMGNLVLSENIQQGNYTKAIDVSKLNAGLFFYNITTNGTKVSSGKLTILNK